MSATLGLYPSMLLRDGPSTVVCTIGLSSDHPNSWSQSANQAPAYIWFLASGTAYCLDSRNYPYSSIWSIVATSHLLISHISPTHISTVFTVWQRRAVLHQPML